MNKLQSTFLTIAILAATVFVVGAYSNPAPSQYDTAGNPKVGPAIVGVTTEGPSQVKTNNLSLQKTFFARGNAIFEDQVLLTGPVYGGKESAQTGDRVLSVGTPGETSLTSVFAINNVKTIAKLQTTAPAVLPTGTTKTVPVCSDIDGFVVLCGEAAQDVCSNIEGPQDVVPPGMTETGGICTTPITPPAIPVITRISTTAQFADPDVLCEVTLNSPVAATTSVELAYQTTLYQGNCRVPLLAGETSGSILDTLTMGSEFSQQNGCIIEGSVNQNLLTYNNGVDNNVLICR